MKPDETGPRKPYAKPQLTRVTLRPEEAVLAACKNLSVGGPGQPTCAISGGVLRPGVVTRQALGHTEMTGAMTPTETASASGRRVATLSIGGVRVQLASSDRDLTLDIPPSMRPFVCDRDQP